MTPPVRPPCPACGHLAPIVHVHGHGQCSACGTNVQPCCAGDSGNDAVTAGAVGDDGLGDTPPELFPKLFERLGGRKATVTTDALLFALGQHLGSDLEEARLVLEAAERIGMVETAVPGLHRLRVDLRG